MVFKKIKATIKKKVDSGIEKPEKKETAEQLHKRHYDLYRDEEKGKRQLVLEKWNDVVLPEVEKALKDKDVEAFFRIVLSRDFPPSGRAHETANNGLNDLTPLVSDLRQAHRLYALTWYSYSSSFKYSVEQILEKFSAQEVKKASGIENFKDIAPYVYKKGKSFKELIHKWCVACELVQEIKDLKDFLQRCSESSEEVDKKADELLFYYIPKATDIAVARSYYEFADEGGVTQMLAFEKWVDLCKTPQEAQEAYDKAPSGKIACSLTAYKRVRELAYAAT